MKRYGKRLAIISAVLAGIGIILIIVGVNCGGAGIIKKNISNNEQLFIHFDSDDMDTTGMEELTENESLFSKDEVKNIELKGRYGEFEFCQWNKEEIGIGIKNHSGNIKYSVQESTLKIVDNGKRTFWWKNKSCKMIVYIPTDYKLNRLDINMGAGTVKGNYISAGELDIDIGAGEGTFENITADTIKVSVGAGEADIVNGQFGVCDIDVGMGEADITGMIMGNTNIDCGVGSVSLELQNSYKDYNYALKVATGEIELNENEYEGFSNKEKINNNAAWNMNIDCGIGDVSVKLLGN